MPLRGDWRRRVGHDVGDWAPWRSAGIEGPVLFDAGFVFNMLGFVLALAACVLFLCGRALYYQGYEQGEQHADCVLAARIQDRLIDHPDTWDNIDGDFLEVEGALNRVRDRERKVQQALRDESHRKDDLVTYLAHDLRTPACQCGGLSFAAARGSRAAG